MGPSNQDGGQGYSSGGYIADSKVDGTVTSGSQQQWYTRDSTLGSWQGGNWNMTFSGVQGAPANDFSTSYTTLATTPVTREKPYLYVDDAGEYHVFVPSLRQDSAGVTWPEHGGTDHPDARLLRRHPGDSAATINSALGPGPEPVLHAGHLPARPALNVTRADTVVTGIGFPTLVPTTRQRGADVDDVAGVNVSSLVVDAGTAEQRAADPTRRRAVRTSTTRPTRRACRTSSSASARASRARRPRRCRSTATTPSSTTSGRGVPTTAAPPRAGRSTAAATGVEVNGNDVLATGLFVEHYQKYEVLWNGERGRTIFFQNEMPYDVPDNAVVAEPDRRGVRGVQGRVDRDHAPDLGRRRLLLLQHQPVGARGPSVRAAADGRGAGPRPGHGVPRRRRHDLQRGQRHRWSRPDPCGQHRAEPGRDVQLCGRNRDGDHHRGRLTERPARRDRTPCRLRRDGPDTECDLTVCAARRLRAPREARHARRRRRRRRSLAGSARREPRPRHQPRQPRSEPRTRRRPVVLRPPG